MSYTFTPGIDPEAQTALDRVTSYDADKIERVLRGQIEKLGLADMFRNKRVAIKPNLVMKKSPDAAATTHPAVLEAMIRIIKDSAADIVIVESPPGLYTESALKGFYNACGITPVAEKYGSRLNTDMTSREVSLPDGVTAKGFELISPMLDADVMNVRFLMNANADVAEFIAKEGSKVTKKPVKDLGMPIGVTIGGLVRGEEGILVSGNTQIEAGDSVMVFCHNINMKKIEKYFV